MTDADDIKVRPVRREDREAWLEIRRALWSDFDPPEIDKYLEYGRFDGFAQCAVFVAEAADGALVGLAEASARPYADGCTTSPVAYLEGWYVAEGWRRRGVGAKLVRAVEDWGRSMGLKEMASDTLTTNRISRKAHAALGFREEDEIVCFAKKL